jgi:hypothetical protein
MDYLLRTTDCYAHMCVNRIYSQLLEGGVAPCGHVSHGHRAWAAVVKCLIGKDKADQIKQWAKKSMKKLCLHDPAGKSRCRVVVAVVRRVAKSTS